MTVHVVSEFCYLNEARMAFVTNINHECSMPFCFYWFTCMEFENQVDSCLHARNTIKVILATFWIPNQSKKIFRLIILTSNICRNTNQPYTNPRYS